MNSPLLRKAATTILALLLFLYVGYQIYNMNHKKLMTETAEYFTASDSVQTKGLAVRKETLLKQPPQGVIDYVLQSGEKVDKGGTVALVYSSEKQASARRELETVDDEISRLKNLQSPGDVYAASPDAVNNRIVLKLDDLLGKSVAADYSDMDSSREDLLYLLNEKQIAAGQVTNFNARIGELQKRRNELAAWVGKAGASVVSPISGYFIRNADGFENAVDYSSVNSLSASQIKSLLASPPSLNTQAPGKVCGSFNWYFVCVIPAEKVAAFRRLNAGMGSVSIQFPFETGGAVPATVTAVNQNGQNAEAAVILKSSCMNSTLASLRCETAQIVIAEYTGIRVSRASVHFLTVSGQQKNASSSSAPVKKEVPGVFVLNGNQLEFRQIFPEFSTDSYVICDPNPPQSDILTRQTIKLHDEVVLEGTDLYDGKVIQ